MKLPTGFFVVCALLASGAAAPRQVEEVRPLPISRHLPFENATPNFSEAVEQLENRLGRANDDLDLKMDLGRMLFRLAQSHDLNALRQAEGLFESVLSVQPENAEALAYRGFLKGLKVGLGFAPREERASLVAGNHGDLDRAVQLSPDSIEIRMLRGYDAIYTPSTYARSRIGIEDFRRVLDLGRQQGLEVPEGLVLFLIGDLLAKEGNLEDALRQYQIVADRYPNTGEGLAAESRLARYEEQIPTESMVLQTAALVGFLLGAALFGVLFFMIARERFTARRPIGGSAASLAVAAAGIVWNAANLTQVLLEAVGSGESGIALLEGRNQSVWFLAAAMAPIPFGTYAAYRFHKASFMDIVLKRGTAIAAISLIAAGYSQLVEAQLASTFLSVRNPAIQRILFNGIWVVVYLLYPVIRNRTGRLVDRHLFKRQDYSQLLDGFNDRLGSVTDRESLEARASAFLRQAFRAQPVVVLGSEDPLAELLYEETGSSGEAALLQQDIADDSLFEAMKGRGMELALLACPHEGRPLILLAGPRAFGQSYLSEELSALRSVAALLERSLENIHLNEERRRQAIREEELRKLATEAELRTLRAQIDPHFFFNSLNSLAELTAQDPQEAERLIEDLSSLFRHRFRSGEEFVRVEQELELVETYLKIEKVRLGERLRIDLQVDEGALPVLIPALSIQPLVENAVRHGLEKRKNSGRIRLSVRRSSGQLMVEVSDDGAGFSDLKRESVMGSGVGLCNVDARLTRLFGESSRVRIANRDEGGASAWFGIPDSAGAAR